MGGQKMRTKIVIMYAFMMSNVLCYAQETGLFGGYSIRPNNYVILRETSLFTLTGKSFVENKKLSPGAIFQPSFYSVLWVNNPQGDRVQFFCMDYDEDNGIKGYISAADVAVSQSGILPESIINKEYTPRDFCWIPSCTLDIIRGKDRELIFTYEKGRPESGYDYNPKRWYEGNPNPLIIYITNTTFSFTYLSSGIDSQLMESIEDSGSYFTVTFGVHRESYQREPPHLSFKPYSYIDNLPNFYGHNLALLLLELNAAANRMRVYNGETKRIVFDFIKVSADFYDKYIQFIETNEIPEELIFLPEELLEGWPGDIKISPLYADGEKLSYRTTSNLRLRSMPDITGEVVATLRRGMVVTPLEPGLSDTIDGMRAPWVWVETQGSGKQGWCFSGYLEPVQEAPQILAENSEQAAENPAPPPSAEVSPGGLENSGKPAVPFAFIIAGGAACLAALGVIVFLRRKKPSS
jgi:hypothetical protein